MKRVRILIFIDWFTPGFKAGGPIKSVTNIVNSLHSECDFDIITSDRDIGEVEAYTNLELEKWIPTTQYRIIYLTAKNRKNFVRNCLKDKVYDFIYFNSAFSKGYTLDPLRIIKKLNIQSQVIVAPRGMFGKGALAIKPLKKKVFLVIAKMIGLYKSVLWHATNEGERDNIVDVFGPDVLYKIAGNINGMKVKRKILTKDVGSLRLIFFSRISIKKNLSYILDLLEELNEFAIELDIYGPIEDEAYWKSCSKQIKRMELPIKFMGAIKPSIVQETLSKYHFFILPTLHENFGHVIVEALSSGCGLIISDQTPWSQLGSKGVGWDIPLAKKEKWLSVISECFNMSRNNYSLIRDKSYEFALKETDDKIQIELTRRLFSQ